MHLRSCVNPKMAPFKGTVSPPRARLCRQPPKSITLVVFSRFLLEVDFGPFLNNFLTFFSYVRETKNILKYSVFVLFAYRNSILQHGESCINTNVFARPRHKNMVKNTVIFATRGKNHRKYRGLGFQRRRKHRYLRCFFAPRGSKKCENTTYVTIFRLTKMRQ